MKNFYFLLAVAILAQVLDGLTFLLAFERYGITGELNPVAVYLYGLGGLPLVLGPKALGVTCVSIGLIWLDRRLSEAAYLGALALLLAGVVGFSLNALAFLL